MELEKEEEEEEAAARVSHLPGPVPLREEFHLYLSFTFLPHLQGRGEGEEEGGEEGREGEEFPVGGNNIFFFI